jgi:hypothetical protein
MYAEAPAVAYKASWRGFFPGRNCLTFLDQLFQIFLSPFSPLSLSCGVALEFVLDDGDQDIGNEAANLRCIRELLRIAWGRTFRVGCAMAGAKAQSLTVRLRPDQKSCPDTKPKLSVANRISRFKSWTPPNVQKNILNAALTAIPEETNRTLVVMSPHFPGESTPAGHSSISRRFCPSIVASRGSGSSRQAVWSCPRWCDSTRSPAGRRARPGGSSEVPEVSPAPGQSSP